MNTHASSESRWTFWSSIVVLTFAILLFVGVPYLWAQNGPRATEAGYGYGTTACTAAKPKKLRATHTAVPGVAVQLSWARVKFTDCDKIKPQSYIVKVYKGKKMKLVKTFTVKKNKKNIKTGVLKKGKYAFRVRAVAVDETKTDFSKKRQFRIK